MKITKSGECGNSPKNAFVEDFIIDFICANDVSAKTTEDARIPPLNWKAVTELRMTHAISHGRVGAGNGVLISEGREIAFAVMVEFANTKGDRVKTVSVYSAAPA